MKVTWNTVELYEQSTQMGLSYQWYSDCNELFTWCDHCVCTSGNAPSRDGPSNTSPIHHAPSDYSYFLIDIDNGNTANEEERVFAIRNLKHEIIRID